jgi:nucleoside-diphosphate-sugar epimerase
MGFMGSHLARHCIALGWDVSTIYPYDQDLTLYNELLAQTHAYPVHGATSEIVGILAEANPDLVFHLASIFVAEHDPEDVVPLFHSNVLLGAQVLEAMALNGVRFLVNTGSSWQHFEDRLYCPVNLYAATKQAFEDIMVYYIERGDLTAITLKLFDTYGPGDQRKKLIQILHDAAQQRKPLAMSPGDQLMDLVHVDDVVRAFIVAAERLLDGKVKKHDIYAVSSGAPLRLRDVVELYQQATGGQVLVVWGERPYRRREVMVPWSKGKRLPGWSPNIGLREGFRDLFKENL